MDINNNLSDFTSSVCLVVCLNNLLQWGISASDIADQIGGLTAIGAGQGCGTGYSFEIPHKRVEKTILNNES